MTEKENTPAIEQGAQSNLSKDTNFMEDTQLLDKVEVIIPGNSKLDTTPILPTYGVSHLDYFIDHITEIYNCPRDYAAFCVMSAVGTAIGTEIASDDGKFKNSTQVWGMLVGEQGCSKSEPLKRAFQPLYELDLEKHAIYKEAVKNWTEGNPKPSYNHTLLGDTTPEYKYNLLSRNTRGTNYIRDELASKFAELNRYNTGSDVETELSIYNHYQITITRKSEEPLVIQYPFMSQIGSIQPDILVKYMSNDIFLNNGYLARWLFVFPDNRVIPYYSNKILDEKIINRYNKFIRYISSKENLGIVPYTDEARRLYIGYYDELQDKIRKAEGNFQKGIYAKLQIHVQRWALITLTARLFEVDERMEISGLIMQYSIDCMRYFEYTAMKVHDMILNRTQRNPAKAIGKEDAIRLLAEHYPEIRNNVTLFAKSIGKSHSFISQTLKR